MDARSRELLILRTGWLCQAPFEWGEHVKKAKAAGVTAEEIEQITVGSSSDIWGDTDRALLRAAEELHDDAMISDATWEVLSRRLSEEELIEVPMVVGQFTTVSYFQNALRLPLGKDNEGLAAR